MIALEIICVPSEGPLPCLAATAARDSVASVHFSEGSATGRSSGPFPSRFRYDAGLLGIAEQCDLGSPNFAVPASWANNEEVSLLLRSKPVMTTQDRIEARGFVPDPLFSCFLFAV